MEIKNESTVEAWKDSLKYIMKHGLELIDINKRNCKEVMNLKIIIKNPKKDITMPFELLDSFKKWVYPPIEEIKNIILAKKIAPVYGYSYGPRIFNYDGINQVDDFIIPLLKQDPSSRRGIVTLWRTDSDSRIYEKNIPGLVCIHFMLRQNKLNLTVLIRSNDMFFGWPANAYQAFVLQSYVAEKLKCQFGSITLISISAHIFKEQFADIEKVLEMK